MQVFGLLVPFLLLISLELLIGSANGASIIRQVEDSSKRIQNLDDEGKVVMSWIVDDATGVITFEVEAETTGYIGFGISPQGSMVGADIFIAGVNPDGSHYSSDRYADAFAEPKIDNHSDWELLEAREFEGISKLTYIKFSRLLNTCDEQDYPISNDTNRLIWAIGDTDVLSYHKDTKGARSIHLLGAPMPELETDNIPAWDFIVDMSMPSVDTAYWCTYHKGPLLNKQHHVIGFEAFLPDANSLKHTHHFAIYNCYNAPNANDTLDEIFKDFTFDTGYGGDLCFKQFSEGDVIPPSRYCSELLYVWAKGGRQMALPEDVGYPIGPESKVPVENPLQQYYMLEVHYDNPEEVENVRFQTGVQMFYTEELREIEAGMLVVMHDTNPSLTVPPDVENFVVNGHCSADCSQHFPDDGITIFNSMLHSHLSGRKIKLRHFREPEELPWLDFDDHYDFNYQQNKQLVQPRKVQPGDHLTLECTYDTRWKNGSVVIGELSTQDEMCQAFLWYYPRMEIGICSSSFPIDGLRDFGVTDYDWGAPSSTGVATIEIKAPAELAGDYEETLNKRFGNWTTEFIQEFQAKRRYEEHEISCIIMKPGGTDLGDGFFAKYPAIDEPYEPIDVCSGGTQDPTEDSNKDPSKNDAGQRKASWILLAVWIGFVVAKF